MLEAAASGTGRSLSQEIEFRLEQSLREDADRVRFYGGADLDGLFKQIAGAIGIIEQTRGKRWRQDQKTFMCVIGAFKEVLAQIEGMRPPADPEDVSMVSELRAMAPDEPRPPEVSVPAQVEQIADSKHGLLGGPRFRSVEEARQAAEQWADYQRQQEEYLRKREAYQQRLAEVNAYFEQFTRLGKEAVAQAFDRSSQEE
jgi:hypothetical protein